MTSRASSIVRRSLLYVPSSSQRMLTKSLGLTSDNVTYDLEDSVALPQKQSALKQLQAHISHLEARPSGFSELAVRINSLASPFADDDLQIAKEPLVDAIVVPKVDRAADLQAITDRLRHEAPERHGPDSKNPIKVIALIESARAVVDLREICEASPYLSGLIFAAEDFALDLSITRTPSLQEFLYARSAIVTAARAFRLPSVIDLVCTSYKGDEGAKRLEEECKDGQAMGFNGKQCIHPSQVDIVQRIFAPSEQEVEWAVRVSIANNKAVEDGRGAWTLDGKMIDAPVVGKANALVSRAEQCGFNTNALRNKWKAQEPE